MADNYLITGYWGEPHVTAENDRGINAGIVGVGRYVLPVGKQFRAEYIGNNTVRVYDGKLVDNGAAGGIPAGEYVDLVVSNASQGMNRNDLIVFQYTQDASTLVESGTFVVIQGVETEGTAVDPELQQEDLLSGNATFDQMALWRVPVSTGTISAPVQLFKVSKSLDKAGSGSVIVDAISSDGAAYTATVEDLEELYNGLEITIIPNIVSTTTAPTLDVNGLGAKPIRLTLSSNNTIMVQPDDNGYYAAGRPIKLMFDSKYLSTGVWKVMGKQRPSADDLYGTTPVTSGGTGLDSVTKDAFLVGNGEEPMQELTLEELQNKIGCMALDVLWTNTGGGNFSAQSVTANGASKYLTFMIITTQATAFVSATGSEHTLYFSAVDNESLYTYTRNVKVSGGTFTFGDCYRTHTGEDAEPKNDRLIPVSICGVKGTENTDAIQNLML